MQEHSSTPLPSSLRHAANGRNVSLDMSTFEEAAMTFEYDEKGKIFTDIVSKVAVPATIQTTTHLIHGQLHVRKDQRIKDALDLNEDFLAVTDVNVLGPDGQTLFQAPFLAIRRSHIIWVLPEQNPNSERA